MTSLKNVTMTPEEYELYCQFLEQRKEPKTAVRPSIVSGYEDSITEISHSFSEESFRLLKDKIILWKYPKGTLIRLSNHLGYLIKGVIKSNLNSKFLNYTTPGNWIGTLKISQALISNEPESWDNILENYHSNIQMIAQTDIIIAMIELDSNTVNKLKEDHIFKNALLKDLTSIIKANDSLQYLLMHRTKSSIMASYLLWKLEKESLEVWRPIPTELSERLNFSLSDTRRSINKLIEEGAIIEGENFAPNAKKKYYLFADNAKEILLKESGLDQHQINDLARILFDSSSDTSV
jgi:hypothetical protein